MRAVLGALVRASVVAVSVAKIHMCVEGRQIMFCCLRCAWLSGCRRLDRHYRKIIVENTFRKSEL